MAPASSTVPSGNNIHPFLRGNFAPVEEEFISHSCDIVHGAVPTELLGGQYIRNGGNPVYPPEKGRHYHW
jgi:carotenoid cleavage dioxygenase-like enzyme